MSLLKEIDLSGLQRLSSLPCSALSSEGFVDDPDIEQVNLRESLIRERENLRERLCRRGFDPDYLFGEGRDFRYLREVRGVGRLGRQERIRIPSARDGTNWFDVLSAAIRSREKHDHSLDMVLNAFGIRDIKYASDGGLMGASFEVRRGGIRRICDLFDPLQVKISFLRTTGNISNVDRIANLAALAFVPDNFWRGFMFREREFVVARSDATRPQKGINYLYVVGPGSQEREERIGSVDALRAENLCLHEGKPLFTVSILPPND